MAEGQWFALPRIVASVAVELTIFKVMCGFIKAMPHLHRQKLAEHEAKNHLIRFTCLVLKAAYQAASWDEGFAPEFFLIPSKA
jgi:hypothetical protein